MGDHVNEANRMENHFTQPTFVFWCALCSRPTVAVIRVLNRLFTRT